MRGVLNTTLCDKVCQWLATGLWFSRVSSTIKTDCHKITEILLKVVLNTITLTSLYVLSNQLTLKLIIYKLSTRYISIYKCQLWAKIKHIKIRIHLTFTILCSWLVIVFTGVKRQIKKENCCALKRPKLTVNSSRKQINSEKLKLCTVLFVGMQWTDYLYYTYNTKII